MHEMELLEIKISPSKSFRKFLYFYGTLEGFVSIKGEKVEATNWTLGISSFS